MRKIRLFIISLVLVVVLTAFGGIAIAAEAPEINTGLPTVTSDQFIDKASRIVASIYQDAKDISPLITLGIVVVFGILGIFFQKARETILWAVISMLLILWGPQIISLIRGYAEK